MTAFSSVPATQLAFPLGGLPERPRPMRAAVAAEPFDSPRYVFEAKWGCVRVMASIVRGRAVFRTISGRNITAVMPDLARRVTKAIGMDGVVLDGDGLGIVGFGAPVEPALGTLIEALGQPVADTGWIDPFSIYGDCPGSRLRVVEWPGVLAFFGDPEDRYLHRDPAGEHFMSWRLGTFGPDPYMLRTAAGIGVGSTRDEVAAAYPAATFVPSTAGTPPSVVLETAGGELDGVFDTAGRLWTLTAGTRCATR